jgi:hypothetical protein
MVQRKAGKLSEGKTSDGSSESNASEETACAFFYTFEGTRSYVKLPVLLLLEYYVFSV